MHPDCPKCWRKNRHIEHVEEDNSNDKETQDDGGKERHEKVKIVCAADAVVKPDAVVVEVANAFVAAAAML